MKIAASPVGLAYAAAIAFAVAVVYQLVKNKKAIATAVTDTAKTVVDAITPTNPDNIIAQGANAVARVVTGGDPGATLGTTLFEKLNPGTVAAERNAAYGTPGPGAATVYPGLDAELRAGAPADWRDQLAGAWESAVAESANQNNARARIVEGEGGAAFGLYPGAR